MKLMNVRYVVLSCLLPLVLGASLGQCPGKMSFQKVCENGFGDVQTSTGMNDYPWSMTKFIPDGESSGFLYVGTGKNVAALVAANASIVSGENPTYDGSLTRPPEIYRYRTDLDPPVWEKVFDYADIESEGNYQTVGFREMKTYRAQNDGVNYLYASTFSVAPSIWRSASGEPGSWEQVWTGDELAGGSVRAMAVHNGLLYFAPTNELDPALGPAQLWATDGEDFWVVNEDGFGNANNIGIADLVSFNDWLYVGLANFTTGFEVWKLAGPDKQAAVQVMTDGGSDPRNEIAGTFCVFQDHLYVGSMMFFGLNPRNKNFMKGCEIFRIDMNDEWDVVVGKRSLSHYRPGFHHPPNAYLWSMTVHDGYIYAGTWDMASLFPLMIENLSTLFQFFRNGQIDEKRASEPIEIVAHAGADLYRSPDGIHWEPVFKDGLENAGNYGIRTMLSVDDKLYVGFANPWDGLEIWESEN